MPHFEPEGIDVDAELVRVEAIWRENNVKYGWDWDEAKFAERMADWRASFLRHIDNYRQCRTLAVEWETTHHYRYPEVTAETWRAWSYYTQPILNVWDDLPCLLLGVDAGPITFHEHSPYGPALWSNQTGGFACEHPRLHGVQLPLSDKGFRIASKISQRWLDSNIMRGQATLIQLSDYRRQLLDHQLDCDRAYHDFHEAWYPVDLEYLPLLVEDLTGVATTYDAVEEWITATIAPRRKEKFLNSELELTHPWKLILCGENCD